jgi:hypothetical protein
MIKAEFKELVAQPTYTIGEWKSINKNSECIPRLAIETGKHARTVEVENLSSGAAVEIHGRLGEGNFNLLHDTSGAGLVFNMDDIRSVGEVVREIVPKIVGGTDDDEITVRLILR